MRETSIIYAHPDTLRLMAEQMRRFSGTRHTFRDRLYAAWLVFTGRADALSWEEWDSWQDGHLACNRYDENRMLAFNRKHHAN